MTNAAWESSMDYSRIHRLLRIIMTVQSERGWTAPRMALEMGVTERTIYRDLEVLRETGVPIDFDQESGGYAIRGDFFLPPVALSTEEALAMIVLCRHVAGKDQIPFLEPAWRAASKLRQHLPRDLHDEVDAVGQHIAIRMAPSTPSDDHRDVYARMQTAITSRCAVQCRYESAHSDGDPAAFEFHPYALFFGVRAWYAIGWHAGRSALRSLKLSRFTSVQPTDTPYEIPEDFSLDDYLGDAWRMIRGETTYDVELRFTPDFADTVSETHWHASQETELNDDGSLTFRCRVSGLDEIVWWVLSMGPHCRVVGPTELADRVADLAARTAALYAPERASD